jgi:hypothetical protein
MLVECLNNVTSAVPTASSLGRELLEWISPYDRQLALTVKRYYTVYAIEIRNGHPWFFVADDDYDVLSYPNVYPSICFAETDRRVSSCWTVQLPSRDARIEVGRILMAFSEWVEQETFFELLIDGNDREVELFQKYKLFMDLEYPSPTATETARELQEDWVICPQCSDAWESESDLALVRCPKCRASLRNPRYSPRKAMSL